MEMTLFVDSGAPSIYNTYVRRHKGGTYMGSYLSDRKNDDFSWIQSEEFLTYRRDYALFLKKNLPYIDYYANFDVINNAEATWDNQQYFESKGLKPIPVWHFGTDIKWLEMYLSKGYDYIAIGGLIPNPPSVLIPALDSIWSTLLTDSEGMPKVKVHGFAVTSTSLIARWPWYCMTDSHKVLTKRGWLGREDIKIGDFVLTRTDVGTSEWKPVKDVFTFDVEDALIRRYKGRFSSETTLNHKWQIYKELKDRSFHYFGETKDFRSGDKIPRSAEHTGFPICKTFSDELVKLVSWVLTDGSTGVDKRGRIKVSIYQSISEHPFYVDEIRTLLSSGNFTWSESKEKTEVSGSKTIVFYISGEARKRIGEIVGYPKELSFDFILSLTRDQLEMFVEECLKGDGGFNRRIKRGDPTIILPQKKGSFLEGFKLACVLLGKPISSHCPKNNVHEMETVETSNVLYHTPWNCDYIDFKYTGKIWCLEVENHTFFTRCNGSYYWTGNSCDSSSWVKFGQYGIICVPPKRNGKFDYSRTAHNIFVSTRSPSQEISGKHYSTLSRAERGVVDNYLELKGHQIGKSEFKDVGVDYELQEDEVFVSGRKGDAERRVEVIVERGVSNDYKLRDELNVQYYIDLQNSIPPWPWAFTVNQKKGFFEI